MAIAIDMLKQFDRHQKKRIFEYTNQYFPDLKFNGNFFEISNEEDIKNLLYGIEQRFYTRPVTNEKRWASAVYKL